ncbi:cytochrome P450 [Mycolicibacterium litorale]|uniref:cytochrome P450 n=1 Tax=Mycolicibacterium litorale TaxID=758802 RepID=UPI003CEDB605
MSVEDVRLIEDLPRFTELEAEDFGRDFDAIAEDLYGRSYVGPYQGAGGSLVVFTNDDVRRLAALPEATHPTSEGASAAWHEKAPEDCENLVRFMEVGTFVKRQPEHLPVKKLFTKRLTLGNVRRHTDSLRDAIRTEVDRIADGSVVDLVDDFARPVIVRYWAEVLGIAIEESQQLADYAAQFQLSSLFDPSFEQLTLANEAAGKYLELFTSVLERGARAGTPELPFGLEQDFLAMSDVGRPDNPHTTFAGGAVDGLHTLASGIANAVHSLITEPSALAEVRADRNLIADATQESLRLHPSVVVTPRAALRDIDFDGLKVPAGTLLSLVWLLANRDPSVWEAPEEFRLNRPDRHRQVTFGGGPYVCGGRNLVRIVFEVALDEVTAPGVEIAPAGPVEWVPASMLHEPATMPVTVRRK